MKKESKGKSPLTKEKINQKLVFMLEEAIPVEQAARKEYVSDIAFFYQKIFKKKIQHFIGLQLEELARFDIPNDVELYIKANINCLRLMDSWFNQKTNEFIGNVETIRNSLEVNQEMIDDLTKNYGSKP